jgi:hypothetical protein
MFIESKGIQLLWWHYILIIFGTLGLLVVVGFLDKVSGLIKAEQQFYADENPFFQEMMRKLK